MASRGRVSGTVAAMENTSLSREALQKPHLSEMGQADLFKLEALGRGRKIVESSQGRESFDFSE